MTTQILKLITLVWIAFGSFHAFAQDSTESSDEQTLESADVYSDIIIIHDPKTHVKHTLVWMDEGYFLDLESLKYTNQLNTQKKEYITQHDVKKKPSFVTAATSLSNAVLAPLSSLLKFSLPLIPVLVSTYSVWGKYVVGVNSAFNPPMVNLDPDGIL